MTFQCPNAHSGREVAERVALTATETAWFQKLLKSCDAVCFVDHRIAFWNPGSKEEGTKGLQGQAVFLPE